MTSISALLDAAARHIATAGVGVYRTDGVYTAGQTGITLKVMPTQPDRVITLTAYTLPTSPDPGQHVQTVRLQVRTRGLPQPPTDVDDLAEAVLAALTGHHTNWAGLRVQRAHPVSSTPLGADQNRRQERSDNLEVLLLS